MSEELSHRVLRAEEVFVDQQQNQHLLDLPKVIAVGIASPAGAALTSRFGVAVRSWAWPSQL
jgi:hypothetical protein